VEQTLNIEKIKGLMNKPLNASSITQPTAIRAAAAVWCSSQVVSGSTPMPLHGSMTKFRSAWPPSELAILFQSSRCLLNELVPSIQKKKYIYIYKMNK
jgi:hypothetical protein